MRLHSLTVVALMSGYFLGSTTVEAAMVGTNQPAQPITAARIAALPTAGRGVWKAYLDRSVAQGMAARAVAGR